MTAYRNVNGVWTPVKDIYVKTAGTWDVVKRGYQNVGGTWKQFHQREVVAEVTANAAALICETLFSSTDWLDPSVNKRVIIDAGITIYGDTTSALYPGYTANPAWKGKLTLDNHGTIMGHAGNANGGAGGHAIEWQHVSQTGEPSIINNYGTIEGGGGAGGVGGQGGAGKYTTVTNPVDGPHYSGGLVTGSGHYWWQWGSSGSTYFDRVYFNGVDSGQLGGSSSGPASSWVYGASTYTRGANESTGLYAVSETHEVDTTTNTTGGAGGTGGQGQGYHNQSAPATGSNGVAGGTNAGTGGKGGAGGAWGTAGSTGSTGSAGNNGSGSAGGAGGAGGDYLYNYTGVAGSVILNNSGTLHGGVLNP